jgi:MSHA pilin protein MshD
MCTERHPPSPIPPLQQGFSLVEVILFILVVSLALAVTVQAFNLANRASADPMLRRQSLAIAQALMDEISYKPFGSGATDDPTQGGFAGPYTAANRSRFDDVNDYDGFVMNGISSLDNLPLAGLGNYRVQVSVAQGAFGAVPASAGFLITVTVTDPAGQSLSLSGYRADY